MALSITSNNATLYCYNAASQGLAAFPGANAAQLWSAPATIGDDLFSATGARQFDGAIDEVAVFNTALTGIQINTLFTTGTGILIPAVIQTPLSGQTAFVNAGTVNFTVTAVNGPLFYQWLLNGKVLTNGANGFSGTLFSGAATNTLAISNYPATLAGQTLMVSVTNAAVNTPATSSAVLPALFPTPALWTVNFAGSNVTAYAPYNGGTFLDLGFTGYGAIGQGTIWNNINVAGGSPYTNVSSTNDLGTMANTGVNMAVVNTGNGVGPNPQHDYLLDLYISLPTASTPNGLVVTGLSPGFYNVFIYAQLGTWANRGSLFTYNGVFQTTALGAVNSPFAAQEGLLSQTWISATPWAPITSSSPTYSAPTGR